MKRDLIGYFKTMIFKRTGTGTEATLESQRIVAGVVESRLIMVLLSIGLVILATLLRFAFDSLLGNTVQFVFHFAAITLVGLVAGFRGGILTTILSAPLVWYLWIEPRYSFPFDVKGLVSLAIFIGFCIFVSFLNAILHKAIAARENAELKLRRMIDSIREYAIFSLDTEGNITSWNSGAEITFGFKPYEIIGKNSKILFVPEDQERGEHRKELEKALSTGLAEDERWHLRKEGTRVYVSGAVMPVFNAQKQFEGFTKVGRDVTEKKEYEERIKRLNQELEERVELRTQELRETITELEAFCYTISHDLRAPLRAMKGFAELLNEECIRSVLGPEQCDYIQRIIDASTRMEALIKGLLAYARAGRGKVEIQDINLEEIIDHVLEENRALIQEKHTEVNIERPLAWVRGNTMSISLSVENIILNAMKFVSPDIAPQIRIWTEQIGSRVRLNIEDNGIGISPAYHERIFGVFERLHALDSYEGTGIGLAIVRRSLEKIGGKAGVSSEEGKGSRFWIELPFAKEAEVCALA